jgi:hypothetical protein
MYYFLEDNLLGTNVYDDINIYFQVVFINIF